MENVRASQKHANMDALRKSRAWLELAQNACPSQRLLDDIDLLRFQVHCATHMHCTRVQLD